MPRRVQVFICPIKLLSAEMQSSRGFNAKMFEEIRNKRLAIQRDGAKESERVENFKT
jgi:hypothetical protein